MKKSIDYDTQISKMKWQMAKLFNNYSANRKMINKLATQLRYLEKQSGPVVVEENI